MKTTDFIKENFVADATEAHQDREVQMARSDCYNAAKYAIELHKLLKNISEQQGLDGWVSEKITLANDYLRTVTEYLRYEQQSGSSSDMPEFDVQSATQTLDSVLGESAKSNLQENAFTWYLKAHGRLLSPLTSDEPYKFRSKEEAVAFAKEKYKTNWQNIVPTTYDVPNVLANQPDAGWDEKRLKTVHEEDDEQVNELDADTLQSYIGKAAKSVKQMKHQSDVLDRRTQNIRTQNPNRREAGEVRNAILRDRLQGNLKKRAANISKAGAKFGQALAKDVAEGNEFDRMMNKITYPEALNTREALDLVSELMHQSGASYKEAIHQASISFEIEPAKLHELYQKQMRNIQEQGVAEARKGDTNFGSTVGHSSWVVYDGNKVKRFKSRDGAKAYAEKNGGKVASSEFYADNIQGKQGVAEDMSRAAKGNEKYGKDGMRALAKAGRQGASEKTLDAIRDRHDKYKNVSETTSSGSVATSMGGGNGFVNGGPGTISRPKMKKKK